MAYLAHILHTAVVNKDARFYSYKITYTHTKK
jgi:hypothetical protein